MFSSNSFSKASFSINAFKMAQEDGSARSGAMRLFFYNLQEEALKKDEQVQGKEAPQGTGEGTPAAKPVVVAKPIKKPKPHREPDEVVEEAPPVRLKPIYHRAEAEPLDDVTAWLSVISMELRAMLVSAEPIRIAMLAREAANEAKLEQEEEEEEILLLLAA